MAYTYDLTTDVGLVRLRINDKDDTSWIFSDEEIGAFLALEGGVKRACALALETIASNEVYVSKVIRLLQLSTDGAKVAAELRAQAKDLRTQADYDEDSAGVGFDIAEQVGNVFQQRERLWKQGLRRQV